MAIDGFNAPETKLFVEPFTGWRGWNWNGSNLLSLNGEVWKPQDELHAACRGGYGGHDAPHPNCSCGIFSMKELGDLERHVRHRNARNVVIGTIKMWGNIIEGSKGYRAEYAMIDSLYVPCSDAEIEKAELMKFMYDIEGIRTPTYLRTVMADTIEELYGVTVFRHDPTEGLTVPDDWRF